MVPWYDETGKAGVTVKTLSKLGAACRRSEGRTFVPRTVPSLDTVVKVRGNAGNAVPGPLKIAGERSQATHSR